MVWRRLPKSRLSLEQRLSYVEGGLEVEAGLEEAIRLLRLKGIVESDPRSRDRLVRRADALEAARASVHIDLVTYLDERVEICPLDDRAAETIRARFELLLGLTPQTATHLIVGLAQDLVDRWGFTRPFALSLVPGGRDDGWTPASRRPGPREEADE